MVQETKVFRPFQSRTRGQIIDLAVHAHGDGRDGWELRTDRFQMGATVRRGRFHGHPRMTNGRPDHYVSLRRFNDKPTNVDSGVDKIRNSTIYRRIQRKRKYRLPLF